MNNNKRHKPNDTDTPVGVNGGVINRQLTFQTRKKIDDAASRNDRRLAFTTYDESKNNPAIALPMHTLNVLLHLCSANDDINDDSFSTKEEDKERAEEIFFRTMKDSEDEEEEERRQHQGRRKTEMSYTAMARVYARNGEFEKSFEMVDLCKNGGGKGKDGGGKTQQKLTPKLRTYAPSLRGFCESGNWKRAEDVFDAIKREGLECTEMEFTAMMDVYGREKKTC